MKNGISDSQNSGTPLSLQESLGYSTKASELRAKSKVDTRAAQKQIEQSKSGCSLNSLNYPLQSNGYDNRSAVDSKTKQNYNGNYQGSGSGVIHNIEDQRILESLSKQLPKSYVLNDSTIIYRESN